MDLMLSAIVEGCMFLVDADEDKRHFPIFSIAFLYIGNRINSGVVYWLYWIKSLARYTPAPTV